jgi:hypothetical protein
MPGCIEIHEDSYVVVVEDTQNANIFINGVVTPLAAKVRRTIEHHRIGKNWKNYISQFTDDGERLRKGRIAIERLKDVDYCQRFS